MGSMVVQRHYLDCDVSPVDNIVYKWCISVVCEKWV